MTRHPTHLVVGPPRHGVVSFALALTESLARCHYPAPVIRVGDWTDLDDALGRVGPTGGVHLNFTDRLLGPTPDQAVDRVSAVVDRLGAAGSRVTATLHDVPQPADGGNYRQRVDAYRAVCGALHGRATNSEHERCLLGENGMADPAGVVVVPLPLDLGDVPVRRPDDGRCTIAMLGFVYPGKGHHEVLAAMADAPREAEFLAIGECSVGHDDVAVSLTDAARVAGRRFTITGYLPDDELAAVLHRVTVPVLHHRHVSASGSLNTWIAARRRPLAPVNRYTVEHDRRHPGTVRLYPDSRRGLADALETAVAEPDSTWLADGVVSGWSAADAARRYAETLARWHD